MQVIHKTTPWHITFGTYGTRLHGDARPTVDRKHNQFGTPFLSENRGRERRMRENMKFAPVRLSIPQRTFIEDLIPQLCERGRWGCEIAAAAPDHVHMILHVPREIHGKRVRPIIKRWLSQALSEKWSLPKGAVWWAEGGSTLAIKDASYLRNAVAYVERQRTPRS